MDKEKVSARQQFLKETKNERRASEIRGSKAWLSTQRMLKRSGKVCAPVSPSGMENAEMSTFSIDTVRHLYLLQLAAGQIKNHPGFSSWVEICELQTRPPLLVSWPTSHIIVPRFIRRKAHAFLQDLTARADNHPSQRNELVGEFPGSLYAVLRHAYKTKEHADEIIAKFPLTRQEMRRDLDLDAGAYRSVGSSRAPSFTLLLLECKRLGCNDEIDMLIRMMRLITDNTRLNMLGNALFFLLLFYQESMDNDEFFMFFESQKLAKYISPTESKSKIDHFINTIHTRYLFTAKKRIAFKRKMDKW